jgi:Tol biopolymer transport system component/sugar lactone lactonase YvrE
VTSSTEVGERVGGVLPVVVLSRASRTPPRVAFVLAALCVGGLTAGVSPALGAFPGDNGKIVFESDRDGDVDIWTMNPNGRRLAYLTAGSDANDELPNWSADGRTIVFMSDRETPRNPTPPGFPGPDYELFVMKADGSGQRQLTLNSLDDEDPAWSPDGRWIVFRRDLNPVRGETDYDIVVMKVDGRRERNLTNSPGIHDDHPNWSPDGRKIAFVSERDGGLEIYKMNPDGSNVRRLTFNAFDDEHPNWSPDGRMIVFNSFRNDSFDIYVMRADGGGERRLTFPPGGGAFPAWSPDGRMIAFAGAPEGCCDIFTMRAGGTAQVNRTNHASFNAVPDWQPLVANDCGKDDRDHRAPGFHVSTFLCTPASRSQDSGLRSGRRRARRDCATSPRPAGSRASGGRRRPPRRGADQGGTMRKLFIIGAVVLALSLTFGVLDANGKPRSKPSPPTLLTAEAGGSGSTVGPDGALYVTDGAEGRVLRVDPRTGAVTTFGSGLPKSIIGVGGAIDVAFRGRTAYVLVTLVGSDVGGSDVVGIYRVDGPAGSTVVADIGAFSLAHPPSTDFFVPTGVQYALQTFRGGFLVTDGHHNRVLRVGLEGTVSELIAFGNVVPTGLATRGKTIYMTEAGPVPHLPEDGRVVRFRAGSSAAKEVTSGGRLLVDVEFGRGGLFALAQGVFPVGNPEGSPAAPNTGQLLKVDRHGTFDVVADGLDRPTSLEIIRNTAYVTTFGREIWRIDGISGKRHASKHDPAAGRARRGGPAARVGGDGSL